MTLAAAENAMRLEAQAWAEDAGLQFAWDNGEPKNVHATPTLVWEFERAQPDRYGTTTLAHAGIARGLVYVPAGSGGLVALQRAESLRDLFAGRIYAGAQTGSEVAIDFEGRDLTSYVASVTIPWQYEERRIPTGPVSYETPGAVVAYQAFRQRWEQLVRAPLSLRTIFDDSPSGDTGSPPWALALMRLFAPTRVEVQTMRVAGRVLVALNHPLGTGVQAANTAADTIERAFNECCFRGIHYGTALVNRVGRTSIGTWQTNIRLPFYYEVRT